MGPVLPRHGCVSAKMSGSFWNGRRIQTRNCHTSPPMLVHTSFGPTNPSGAVVELTFHSSPATCALPLVPSYNSVSGSSGLNVAVGVVNVNAAPTPGTYADEV